MIVETLDIVGTWLGHVTHGVNALLPSVPRLGGHAAPPALASIGLEVTSGLVALDQFPNDLTTPALYVAQAEDATYGLEFEQQVWDAESIGIGIAYLTREGDTARAVRDALYSLVAVRESLRRLWTVGVQADRTRGTVALVQPIYLRQSPIFAPLEDRPAAAALTAGYWVRDVSPL